jgi:hypothetical protein
MAESDGEIEIRRGFCFLFVNFFVVKEKKEKENGKR